MCFDRLPHHATHPPIPIASYIAMAWGDGRSCGQRSRRTATQAAAAILKREMGAHKLYMQKLEQRV